MIDAAIVGLGWWGRQIVGTLQGVSDKIRFVRGVDIRPDAAADFAAQRGFPLSADLEDALDDPRVDAVILATPHSLHEQQIVRAAAAGKHVFSEKPLALTRASAARAIAACEEAGVVLGIGHERRFEPALVEIGRLLGGGELGTVMHAEANFSHDGLAELDAGDWRRSRAEAPAAGMTSMGIHLTDSLIHMLGPIDRVYAQTAKRVMATESGDVVSVHLRFESGATGYLNSILATPFFMRFHVFGSDAWVEARDTVRPEAEGITHLTIRRKGSEPETREVESIDTVRANLEAFAEAAAGGAPYPFTKEEILHNIAALEAIVRSAETGRAVPVR